MASLAPDTPDCTYQRNDRTKAAPPLPGNTPAPMVAELHFPEGGALTVIPGVASPHHPGCRSAAEGNGNPRVVSPPPTISHSLLDRGTNATVAIGPAASDYISQSAERDLPVVHRVPPAPDWDRGYRPGIRVRSRRRRRPCPRLSTGIIPLLTPSSNLKTRPRWFSSPPPSGFRRRARAPTVSP